MNSFPHASLAFVVCHQLARATDRVYQSKAVWQRAAPAKGVLAGVARLIISLEKEIDRRLRHEPSDLPFLLCFNLVIHFFHFVAVVCDTSFGTW
jgi:hypothetical protein